MGKYTKFGVYTYGDKDFQFNFNTSLSARQKVSFVNDIVEVVVGDNYYDFLTDIMFDFEIIHKFTDVDVSGMDQIDAIEKFLNDTNIVEIVKENADFELISGLRESVSKCIEYKTGIHRNIVDEALGSLLNVVERKVSNIDVDGMMEMAQVMSGISGELTADKIIEAYGKSDIFKNQYKQISEKREKHNARLEEFNVIKGEKDNPSPPVLSPDYEV